MKKYTTSDENSVLGNLITPEFSIFRRGHREHRENVGEGLDPPTKNQKGLLSTTP
jgi:hypothetical protein